MSDWIPISEVSVGDRIRVTSAGSSWAYYADRASAEASSAPFSAVTKILRNPNSAEIFHVWLASGHFANLSADTHVLRAE